MDDIQMSQRKIPGFDFRCIFDDELLMKTRRLPPPSILADQVRADSEIYKGKGWLGHEADPVST
ncbi:MAG TPA: hypothetical protein VN657_03890 [Nitrospiraceae bacterium]|nr:hypothetical protein [Nitrospiraceae bacterium]